MKIRFGVILVVFAAFLMGGCAHTRDGISIKEKAEKGVVLEETGKGVARHRVQSGQPLELAPGLYVISVEELPAETATLTAGAKKIEGLKKGMAYALRLDAGQKMALTWSGSSSAAIVNTISSAAAGIVYMPVQNVACQPFEKPYVSIIDDCELLIRLSPCKNGRMLIKFTRPDGTPVRTHTSRRPNFDNIWLRIPVKIPREQTPITISIVCEPAENSVGACNFTVGFN